MDRVGDLLSRPWVRDEISVEWIEWDLIFRRLENVNGTHENAREDEQQYEQQWDDNDDNQHGTVNDRRIKNEITGSNKRNETRNKESRRLDNQ